MCLAIPGRIVEVLEGPGDLARVDISGVRREVNISLVRPDGIDVGDWVLIHVGFALHKIDESEAQRTLDYLNSVGKTSMEDTA